MTQNPVRWFEIYVQDMERAKRFYESVFKYTLEKLENPADSSAELWSFPMAQDGYGATGALVKMHGVPSGGNSTLIYFACADCMVEEGRVAVCGGKVERSKTSIGQYGFISIVYDSEGNMIGLHSME